MKKIVKYLATIGMVATLIFSSVNLVSAGDNRTEKIVDSIPFILLIAESIVGITILWLAWNEKD